ncbi:MAG: helix-turn-helix domain-containing protein [Bacteroidales bacterium]
MQLQLPLFPREAKLINEHVGVYQKDNMVHYIVNGMPIYSHSQGDINAFRFITSNLIFQGLCRKVEVERFFHVSEDSVYRYYKKFKAQGEEGFFGADARRGKAHKITGERRIRIQAKLDKGQSVNSIAKEEGVRESAIRYGIKQGYLKKKKNR